MNRDRPYPTIGIAGCGAMGLPMARRLCRAGVTLWGFDIRPAAEFGDLAPRMVTDPATFARRCDIVFSVVRSEDQTDACCFDDQALFSHPDPPKTLVICSTLSPKALTRIRARLPAGTHLVDAPMSGAPIAAETGDLTFMVGGGESQVAALQPYFDIMGGRTHHIGGVGAGMTCKVANNFVTASTVVAVRKALTADRALGLDPATLRRVMAVSSGATWYATRFDDIIWAREGYAPGNTIGILKKDVHAYLDAGGSDTGPFEDAVLAGLRALDPYEDEDGP